MPQRMFWLQLNRQRPPIRHHLCNYQKLIQLLPTLTHLQPFLCMCILNSKDIFSQDVTLISLYLKEHWLQLVYIILALSFIQTELQEKGVGVSGCSFLKWVVFAMRNFSAQKKQLFLRNQVMMQLTFYLGSTGSFRSGGLILVKVAR